MCIERDLACIQIMEKNLINNCLLIYYKLFKYFIDVRLHDENRLKSIVTLLYNLNTYFDI